ncbi:hypothetical protein ABWK22_02465 [Gottfriedia acidiceleris]|uniref:hypothetical protein n=1 Tax=Gottfriedia acidiceleris TaxID=371036 RepID=UPI00339795A6
MIIYQNKKKPWIHTCTMINNYQKSFFFKITPTPRNKWMKPPRFHAMINLFFVSFWRDNSNFRLGVGFGKKHFSVNMRI